MKILKINLIFTIFLLSSCSDNTKTTLANPASLNCKKNGGKTEIHKLKDGSEYGICIFKEGRSCEEWALFRGECPPGGVPIDNYLTPGGTYCALRGGVVLEKETLCQLPAGHQCKTSDLLEGNCR